MKMAVYGTLRKGYGNHHFLRNAKFEGEAWIDGFSLHQAFGTIPGIQPDEESRVKVELYSDYDLEAIDMLEGNGSLYHRTEVEIDGEPCWTYVYGRPLLPEDKIESGDYADFMGQTIKLNR